MKPSRPSLVERGQGIFGPRGQKVLRTGAWSLLAKAAAAANVFLAVPFVLNALGPVEFGAWATLVSLVTFAAFLDFGFGNGTMNLVAAAHGRGQPDEVRAIFFEGRRTLTQVALVLAAIASVAVPLLPWPKILGLAEAYRDGSRAAAGTVVLAVILAVPLNLATRVQLGLGQGDLAFRWQAAGQIVTLLLVIVLARTGASLALLTGAAVLTPLLASAANTALLAHRMTRSSALPGKRRDLAAGIRREGTFFFILQLAAALAYASDLPLVSALRGPADAGAYAISQRLFSVVPMGLGLIWAPLWPLYRHALAAGDHQWATDTLKRSIALALLGSGAAAAVLALGFHSITTLWLGHPPAVPPLLILGLAFWCTIDAVGTAIATFLNAASVVRYQVIVAIPFAGACLAAKWIAIPTIGAAAIPWVTVVCYCAIVLAPTLVLRRRLLAQVLALP